MQYPPSADGGDDSLLAEISPKDKPWDKHRSEADVVRDLYKNSDFSHYADRIEQCSQILQFALRCKDQGELTLKLHAAKFCRVRHCPVCQWRRSMSWRARFFQVIPKLQEAHPAARYIFLTLTVKNCPVDELRDRLTWMNKSWEKLTKRKQFPAIGFVKSVEVTRASDGQAHPHFHALLMVPSSYFGNRYMNQAKWTDLWQSCLRVEYKPVVNVKAVRPRAADGSDLNEQMAKALCETLKYSVKPGDLAGDPEWLHKLTEQLHKTRAVSVGGIFKEYLSEDEPEDDSEDLIHLGLEENKTSKDDPMVFFGWREMIKKYIKK